VCCVDSGICDGLITCSEEFYSVCVCLIVCDLKISTMRRLRPELGCCATGKQKYEYSDLVGLKTAIDKRVLNTGTHTKPILGRYFSATQTSEQEAGRKTRSKQTSKTNSYMDRKICKWISTKQDACMWCVFMWLCIGTVVIYHRFP
jgi:hypothetical protein